MSEAPTRAECRDLFRLGVALAELETSRDLDDAQRREPLVPTDPFATLAALGLRVPGDADDPERPDLRAWIEELLKTVEEAATERYGDEAAALPALGRSAGAIAPFILGEEAPRVTKPLRRLAGSFVELSVSVGELISSELERLRGWAVASENGWVRELPNRGEYRLLLAEVFEDDVLAI